MIPRTLSIAFIAPALASGALLLSAGSASAASETFTANLSGSNEVGGGDGSQTATATVTVDTTSGGVCSDVKTNVKGGAAMHIHKGASGVNGPVVVPLDIKSINGTKTCVKGKAADAKAIAANPAGFYVNIHTPAKPAGIVRGQLTASSGGGSGTPSGANAGTGGQAGTNGPNIALVALMVAGAGMAGAAGWRLVRR